MQFVATNITVADLCAGLNRGEFRVNHDYQRSGKVWPEPAKAFLVESVLLGYPIPKLYVAQIVDLRSRQTLKEIVDGQQRTLALAEFYAGTYKLTRTLELDEAAGKSYDELPEELQGKFLGYPLAYDLIVGASPDEIRETFRRMNLYTIPVNPEEQRHARWQGEFKWFVHHLARRFAEALPEMGIFTQRQLVRMADTKLLAEICHAMLHGISTTSKTKLDDLYRDKDRKFPEEHDWDTRLTKAFDLLVSWRDLYGTQVMKPMHVYSLILAVVHVTGPMATLQPAYKLSHASQPRKEALTNIAALAEALEDPDGSPGLRRFVDASKEQTNVGRLRAIRFEWYCRALTQAAL